MAVKLRLRRMGKKKQPFYRIVAADARKPRDGEYLDNLGTYDPRSHPIAVEVNEERALYWLQHGAIPTDTVRSLLRRKGILLKWDLIKRGYDEERIAEEFKKWEVLQIERRKRLEAAEIQKQKQQAEAEEVTAEEEAAGAETEAAVEQEEAAGPETEAAVEQEEASAEAGDTSSEAGAEPEAEEPAETDKSD